MVKRLPFVGLIWCLPDFLAELQIIVHGLVELVLQLGHIPCLKIHQIPDAKKAAIKNTVLSRILRLCCNPL